MRVLLLAALAACGDNRIIKDDAASPPDDLDPGACQPVSGMNVLMRQIATINGALLLVTGPEADPRQFVLEQSGRIWVIEDESLRAEPFLDVSEDAGGPIVSGSERGLLGLAFHPQYNTNGAFFVFYTTLTKNVVSRYNVSASDPNKADPSSREIVLAIDDLVVNHNGGQMEFGSDGYLYIGTGDGGGAGDPDLNAQDPRSLLGKMLRIDVDSKSPGKEYGIPPTNPYADGVAGAPEIFMLGLRNPWRWSIDRSTGDFWIGDVGQDVYEELHYVPAAAAPGANLGWNMYDGNACFSPPCDPTGKTFPSLVRTHSPEGWCSIIGGAVYRGSCYPDLVGTYLFTDYCAHVLESARIVDGLVVTRRESPKYMDIAAPPIAGFPVTPASLHADGRGELYLTTVSCCGSSFTGGVYRLEVGP